MGAAGCGVGTGSISLSRRTSWLVACCLGGQVPVSDVFPTLVLAYCTLSRTPIDPYGGNSMIGSRALFGAAFVLIAVGATMGLSDPNSTQPEAKVEPAPTPIKPAAAPEPPRLTTITVVRGIERNVYNNVIKEPASSRQPR